MNSALTWCLALAPFALAGSGFLAGAAKPFRRRAGTGAALTAAFALALAVATGVAIALHSPLATGTLGIDGVGLGIYVDTLSAIMFALVAFVGLIVTLYSRNYLDGDPAQGRFTKWLCLTLAAVLLLIVSGNLFQFGLAWIATSVGLNKLLLFYPERQAAVLAARKKFLASRVSDLCLVAAMALLHQAFGSLDYAVLFAGAEAMRTTGVVPGAIHAVAVLLVIAALLKSAQFPLHGWLTEVMETPTPVTRAISSITGHSTLCSGLSVFALPCQSTPPPCAVSDFDSDGSGAGKSGVTNAISSASSRSAPAKSSSRSSPSRLEMVLLLTPSRSTNLQPSAAAAIRRLASAWPTSCWQ